MGSRADFRNKKSDREQLAHRVEEKAKLHRHRHRAEGVLQDEQPGLSGSRRLSRRLVIRAMRLDCAQARPRPVQEIRSASIASLEGDRAGDVDHDCRLGGEFRQLSRERFLGRGSARERLGHRRKRILELARRHCLSSATETQVDGLLSGQSERIGDSGPTRRGGHRRLPPLFAGVGDRDEMAGQIAAVDGGHIFGLERLEIPGIIPIVEVAAKARHANHRRKRRLQPFDGLGRANPTEVAG